MKAVAYLRIAQGSKGFIFGVTSKPSSAPLSQNYGGASLTTVQFRLNLDLPDDVFVPQEVDVKVKAEAIDAVQATT